MKMRRKRKYIMETKLFEHTSLIAGISHELRTPLTAIYGMLDILNHTPLSNEQRESLKKIEFSANRLLALEAPLLALAKNFENKKTRAS